MPRPVDLSEGVWTADQLAQAFRITVRVAYEWAHRYQVSGGPLEAYRTAEGRWLFGIASVRRYMEEGQARR